MYLEWHSSFVGGKLDGMKVHELELEKKSRKGQPTSVDWDTVRSPDYKKRFHGITSSESADRLLHAKALDMLEHRQNTQYEDMHLISVASGSVVGSQTHSPTELTVTYNESLNNAIKTHGTSDLISIHNHPNSKPPNGADLYSAYKRGYKKSVIICHNGDIYLYEVGTQPFTGSLFDLKVDKYRGPSIILMKARRMSRPFGILKETTA